MSYLSLDQFALMPNLRGFFIAQFLDFRFGLFMRPEKIKGSAQDNSGRILAIDLTPGLNLWKLEIRWNGQNQHGITYDNGVIFVGTGKNTTLLALNAIDGKVIWQTIPAGDPNKNYITQGPSTVWKNIALIGHATSSGPINPDLKGKVTTFNRTNGEKLWSSTNTVGPRIQHENATKNGGATIWSGWTLDPKKGIYYVPTSNPLPRSAVDVVRRR